MNIVTISTINTIRPSLLGEFSSITKVKAKPSILGAFSSITKAHKYLTMVSPKPHPTYPTLGRHLREKGYYLWRGQFLIEKHCVQ